MAQEHVVLSADRYQRLMNKDDNTKMSEEKVKDVKDASEKDSTVMHPSTTRSDSEDDMTLAALPPGLPAKKPPKKRTIQAKRRPTFPKNSDKNNSKTSKSFVKKKNKKANLSSVWITNNSKK